MVARACAAGGMPSGEGGSWVVGNRIQRVFQMCDTRLLVVGAILCSVTLVGCVTPPKPYTAPLDQPHASLKSGIGKVGNRWDSIAIHIAEGPCGNSEPKSLFSISMSGVRPEGYVKVAAGRPLQIQFHEYANGGVQCHLAVEVLLEPERSYSLVGGSYFDKGILPLLPGPRMCRIGVVDDADGSTVPLRTACAK